MNDFEKLSEEELYELGIQLGKLSKTRPDIAYRIVLGFRDGLVSWGKIENLGDILWSLWRQGKHECVEGSLSIPFVPPQISPSGSGENKQA